eukprot:353751-Chlamydomonas_euryale.AAC.9
MNHAQRPDPRLRSSVHSHAYSIHTYPCSPKPANRNGPPFPPNTHRTPHLHPHPVLHPPHTHVVCDERDDGAVVARVRGGMQRAEADFHTRQHRVGPRGACLGVRAQFPKLQY